MRRGVWLALGLWLAAGVASAAPPVAADDPYAKEIEAARVQRVARLTAPDGWLTLIGLHFLHNGENTIGSAKDNAVVLAKGPAHLGKLALADDGGIKITLAADSDARVNGRAVLAADLAYLGGGKPTVVSFDTVSFFVIERDGKKALRVKDSGAEPRTHFHGLDYFPVDPSWRIEANWVPLDQPREISVTNILGQVSPVIVTGKAVFEREGKSVELVPIEDGSDGPLFFVISDLTSGKETYHAARFVYAEPPENGKIVLDFNAALNPPCAFTPFATCPLPPKENRLPFAVTAGEKVYHGGSE